MKKLFFFYFFLYYLFIVIYANYLGIGDFEVEFLNSNSFVSMVENRFLSFFGNSNFALRLPSILLSFFSIILYYKISANYLKKKEDIFLAMIVFSLMPGFILATLLFNKSIYIIFLVLLFIYSFIFYRFYSYILLFFYTIIDYSFISLYLGVLFYSIYKKEGYFILYSLFLLMINANYFHYEIGGHPRGHFVDIFLIYSAIFSPFVFIYFLYSIIKFFKTPTLLWFISGWGLLFSILLSFRQKIKIDDFAPFVIIAVVFMITIFFKDYRIRLKIFRLKFKFLFFFLFTSLVIFDIFMMYSPYFLNHKIFRQFRDSYSVFLFLKEHNLNYIKCNNKKLCKKLYFYGIKKGDNYFISFDKSLKKVSISHNSKKIYDFYVSKLNKNQKK